MITIISTLLTFLLIIVCVFLVFVILLQRSSSDGGLGTAFGGGIAESTFGADTGNILTKATIYAAVLFFVLSLGLYLIHMTKAGVKQEDALPDLGVTAEVSAESEVGPETPITSDQLTSVPTLSLGETAAPAETTDQVQDLGEAAEAAVDQVEEAVDTTADPVKAP